MAVISLRGSAINFSSYLGKYAERYTKAFGDEINKLEEEQGIRVARSYLERYDKGE